MRITHVRSAVVNVQAVAVNENEKSTQNDSFYRSSEIPSKPAAVVCRLRKRWTVKRKCPAPGHLETTFTINGSGFAQRLKCRTSVERLSRVKSLKLGTVISRAHLHAWRFFRRAATGLRSILDLSLTSEAVLTCRRPLSPTPNAATKIRADAKGERHPYLFWQDNLLLFITAAS